MAKESREWTLEELSAAPVDRERIAREAAEADLLLLRWLHAEAAFERDAERSSRQAWAAEAMRLEMESAKFREITLNSGALYSAMLVGIGGEHDDPPSNEQIERALKLWEKYINRELNRPGWHPKSTCGWGDACDQHGAPFRHANGTPCWGCQICLEEEIEEDCPSGTPWAESGEPG